MFLQKITNENSDFITDNFNLNLSETRYTMPYEGMPHKRTWMAFHIDGNLWGDLLPEGYRNIATIANTIIQYEPVTMLVMQEDYPLAKKLLDSAIELLICPLNDIWMRDMGPIFVYTPQHKKAAIGFNFNGWGKKQICELDCHVAEFVTAEAKAQFVRTSLIMEGGGIEVNGKGTAILSESCIFNDNRNPLLSKATAEHELKRLLGLQKIIWLPGIPGKEITDGHIDCYARFTPTGPVVVSYNPNPAHFDNAVTHKHIEILNQATDAEGKALELVIIDGPTEFQETNRGDDFAEGYLNYYVCNGAVIAQAFGDTKGDKIAQEKLQSLFPNRTVEMLNIDAISAAGGGIHCITQQEPVD